MDEMTVMNAGFLIEMQKNAGLFDRALGWGTRQFNAYAPKVVNHVETKILPELGKHIEGMSNKAMDSLGHFSGVKPAEEAVEHAAQTVAEPAKKGFMARHGGKVFLGGAMAGAGGLMYAGSKAYGNPGENYTASYGNAFGGGFQAQQ